LIQATWGNFLVAQAGAAAALTRLIFVAVSMNLPKILEYSGAVGLRFRISAEH